MVGVLIGGLFTFLFGGLLLIVLFGAQEIEAELKAKEREARKVRAVGAHVPRFFVTQPAGDQAGKIDEAFASRVQHYLDTEQILADEFVSQPSIENLYRESATRLTWH